jgi:NADPH:quinone reductase-like Zn-dependent oxidoreductase
MRAITYIRLGDPSVLELVERPIPEPGEVRIRVVVSGVNPTDWKSRSGMSGGALAEATVPNHDGAGVVDKLGAGVADLGVGDRVWVTLAGDSQSGGRYRAGVHGRPYRADLPAAAEEFRRDSDLFDHGVREPEAQHAIAAVLKRPDTRPRDGSGTAAG